MLSSAVASVFQQGLCFLRNLPAGLTCQGTSRSLDWPKATQCKRLHPSINPKVFFFFKLRGCWELRSRGRWEANCRQREPDTGAGVQNCASGQGLCVIGFPGGEDEAGEAPDKKVDLHGTGRLPRQRPWSQCSSIWGRHLLQRPQSRASASPKFIPFPLPVPVLPPSPPLSHFKFMTKLLQCEEISGYKSHAVAGELSDNCSEAGVDVSLGNWESASWAFSFVILLHVCINLWVRFSKLIHSALIF